MFRRNSKYNENGKPNPYYSKYKNSNNKDFGKPERDTNDTLRVISYISMGLIIMIIAIYLSKNKIKILYDDVRSIVEKVEFHDNEQSDIEESEPFKDEHSFDDEIDQSIHHEKLDKLKSITNLYLSAKHPGIYFKITDIIHASNAEIEETYTVMVSINDIDNSKFQIGIRLNENNLYYDNSDKMIAHLKSEGVDLTQEHEKRLNSMIQSQMQNHHKTQIIYKVRGVNLLQDFVINHNPSPDGINKIIVFDSQLRYNGNFENRIIKQELTQLQNIINNDTPLNQIDEIVYRVKDYTGDNTKEFTLTIKKPIDDSAAIYIGMLLDMIDVNRGVTNRYVPHEEIFMDTDNLKIKMVEDLNNGIESIE